MLGKWPNEAVSWLLKGQAGVDMAWQARGNGYANTVSAEGWKTFRERLAGAESDLEKAWQLDPKDVRIPLLMMTVCLGNEKGRPRHGGLV